MSKRDLKQQVLSKMVVDYIQTIQQRPWTAVVATAKYDGRVYVGKGFSKVSWPDFWSADYGYALAYKKAEASIVRQIIS